MRYSTYNAIPQYPKSKKHPYETLENKRISAFLLQIDNKYYTNVSKNVQIS